MMNQTHFSCSGSMLMTESIGSCRSSYGHESRKGNSLSDSDSTLSSSQEATELANALAQYKLIHRRHVVSFEEMLGVLRSLGYHK